MKEIICYGEIYQFRSLATPREFYAVLRLAARLEDGEISSVSQIYMNPIDHEALRTLLAEELIRRNSAFLPDRVRAASEIAWLDQGPAAFEAVPPGELWIVTQKKGT